MNSFAMKTILHTNKLNLGVPRSPISRKNAASFVRHSVAVHKYAASNKELADSHFHSPNSSAKLWETSLKIVGATSNWVQNDKVYFPLKANINYSAYLHKITSRDIAEKQGGNYQHVRTQQSRGWKALGGATILGCLSYLSYQTPVNYAAGITCTIFGAVFLGYATHQLVNGRMNMNKIVGSVRDEIVSIIRIHS
jgi:hypothetical protein